MKLNKWYYRDNEDGEIDFDSGFKPCYFEQDFNKVEYLDIKGNRYSIFDKSYHYLGELNL